MSRMQSFVTKHCVPTYFGITFIISWGGALLAMRGSDGMSGINPMEDPRFLYALLAMVAGPTVAGILLTAWVDGKAGLRGLVARLTKWRVSARWYAVALLTAPLVMMVTLLALSLFSPSFLPGIFMTDDKRSLLLFGLGVGMTAGIFEELGWVGFAVPELRLRHNVLQTGLIVGVIWGAWHLLTNVFWASTASAGELSMPVFLPLSALGALVGYLPAFRVLMVWVYDHTGSLPVAMLMHVSLTASLLILNPLAISGITLVVYSYVLAAAMWVVAMAAVAGSRKVPRETMKRVA